jgi:hypothetical protein
MPLREVLRFLSFPSRFQVYGLKITPKGLAQNVPPVVVELMLGATPISQKQYFIPCKAQVRSEFKNTLTDSYSMESFNHASHPGTPL